MAPHFSLQSLKSLQSVSFVLLKLDQTELKSEVKENKKREKWQTYMKKSGLFYQAWCLVDVSLPTSSPYDDRTYICED